LIINANGSYSTGAFPISWSGGVPVLSPGAEQSWTSIAVTPDSEYLYVSVGSSIYYINTDEAIDGDQLSGNVFSESVGTSVSLSMYESGYGPVLYATGFDSSTGTVYAEEFESITDGQPTGPDAYYGLTGAVSAPSYPPYLPLQFSGQYAYLFVGAAGGSSSDQGLYVFSVYSPNGQITGNLQAISQVDTLSIDRGAEIETTPQITGNAIYFGTAAGILELPILCGVASYVASSRFMAKIPALPEF
jgi:hypothetical protein